MNKYDGYFGGEKDGEYYRLLNKIENRSVILEFGSATGRFTRFFSEDKGCKVYIVEYDKAAYALSSRYAVDGLCCDADSLLWKDYFKGIEFDYIIFGDVLEHLREPDKVFKESVSLLKDSGKIIFSIPNAAHVDVMLNMFYNDFKYTSTGLLVNTHIHLFAYNNVIAFANNEEVSLTYLCYTNISVNKTEQKPVIENSFIKDILFSKDYSDVYQFVGVCMKNSFIKENNIEVYNIDKEKFFKKRTSKIKVHSKSFPVKVYYNTGSGFNVENTLNIKPKIDNKNGENILVLKNIPKDTVEICVKLSGEIFAIDSFKLLNENGVDIKNNGSIINEYTIFDEFEPVYTIDTNKINNKDKVVISYKIRALNNMYSLKKDSFIMTGRFIYRVINKLKNVYYKIF